jgi:hypothetical protein
MPLESATFIGQLNPSYPDGSNPKSEGDDHIRLVKTTLQATWPNIGAVAVLATGAELNHLVGVSSAIQTQLLARSLKAGETYTGSHDFTGASVTVATATLAGHPMTKAQTEALAFASALPGVSADTKGKVITNDGVTGSWGDPELSAQAFFYATT